MPEKQTSIAVSAEMNECLKLGSGKRRANVRYWVSSAEGQQPIVLTITMRRIIKYLLVILSLGVSS